MASHRFAVVLAFRPISIEFSKYSRTHATDAENGDRFVGSECQSTELPAAEEPIRMVGVVLGRPPIADRREGSALAEAKFFHPIS